MSEEYKKELSQIIDRELKDPSITGMISVTKVKVTNDLKYAKIYISILNSKNEKAALEGLKKSSGFIRTELAKRVNLRNTPELIFEKDELNINGKKVLYRSIKKVQIIENKNKYHLIIRAKGNEYLYKTNQKNSQHVLECLKKYCPRIDKNRD